MISHAIKASLTYLKLLRVRNNPNQGINYQENYNKIIVNRRRALCSIYCHKEFLELTDNSKFAFIMLCSAFLQFVPLVAATPLEWSKWGIRSPAKEDQAARKGVSHWTLSDTQDAWEQKTSPQRESLNTEANWRDILAQFGLGIQHELQDHHIVVLKKSATELHLEEHIEWALSMYERYLASLKLDTKWVHFNQQEKFGFEHYERILADSALQHKIIQSLGKRRSSENLQASFGGLKNVFQFKKYHTSGFYGYAAKFPKAVMEFVKLHPSVAYVEQDQKVVAFDGEPRAPWNLGRLSHKKSILYDQFFHYCFQKNGGDGVKVYVIDTGVRTDHMDLEGRATLGFNFVKDDKSEDGNGHGSHVSGIIAGKRFGVAKKANIVGVKVLNGDGAGTMSDVLAGIDWVASAHIYDLDNFTPGYKGAIMNLSLGGPNLKALNEAIDTITDVGVHAVVAAGNDNEDACSLSPAGANNVITVGATTIADERASYSNWGKCVAIFAPGSNVRSIWNSSPTATQMLSGTSMASPHIAGLAAYILSLQKDPLNFSASKMKETLVAMGTKGILSNVPSGTKNLLAYNNYTHPDDL